MFLLQISFEIPRQVSSTQINALQALSGVGLKANCFTTPTS